MRERERVKRKGEGDGEGGKEREGGREGGREEGERERTSTSLESPAHVLTACLFPVLAPLSYIISVSLYSLRWFEKRLSQKTLQTMPYK